MPAISKIRFTNLVYENGAKRYRDEIFRFDSHNGVILLENGGGKTVLVQALLQVVLPHAALAERKAKDTFSLENSPAHIAVEWIINEKPRRYALTVVTLFSSKEGLDSYKYVYEYESGDKNSLEGLPLVRQGSDGRLRPASKAEMYDYYLAMSRSSMNAHYFPSIREYQQYIEENFKIIISEWRSIARINSAEGEVEGFFEGCKTTAQLVDRLLIPIVEEAMAGSGSQDFVETFQKQREHFKKHSQLQERIEESQKANSQIGHYVDAFASYHQAGQKMDNVRGQAKSLYRLALKEEQRVAQSMEHHQEASQSCQEQRQELDRKWASYELAQLELSMNQARQLWQQRQEEWQAQLEDYRNQHRRLQNLPGFPGLLHYALLTE
jgi:predicted ATPase